MRLRKLNALTPTTIGESITLHNKRHARAIGARALAEAEADKRRKDHATEVEQASERQRIIQNDVFELIKTDAIAVSDAVKGAGVVPTPGKKNCHSVERQTGPTSVWPVRIVRFFNKEKAKGRPVFEKSGVAVAAETGELVFFKDGDTAHGDKLINIFEPADTRHNPRGSVRRPAEAEDVVPLRNIDPSVPVDEQLPLVEWRSQLYDLAANEITGTTYQPAWINRPEQKMPPPPSARPATP